MKNITSLALLLGLICIAACGPITGPCGRGRKCSPPVEPSQCDLDVDTETRTFVITAFEVPSPTQGFDIDGLVSTETDLSGCYVADAPGGIDNALAVILPKKPDILTEDLGDVVNGAIRDGELGVEVVLDRWNGTSSDACVGVTLSVTERGVPLAPLTAVASLVDGTIERVDFDQDLALAVTPSFDTDVALDMTIRSVSLRLAFDPSMTNVLWGPTSATSSMLGGYVRYLGEDGSALAPSLRRLVESLDPALVTTVENLFLTRLDLDSTPYLSTCVLTGGEPSADAFSMAMMITSAPSE